jgi:hypothetical protein
MSESQNRIIETPDDVYFNEVPVIEGSDWSDAEDADNDLNAALGLPFGGGNRAAYYQFWEGSGDPDDFASMRIQKSGTATWADFFNSACDFASTPAEGSIPLMICAIVKAA